MNTKISFDEFEQACRNYHVEILEANRRKCSFKVKAGVECIQDKNEDFSPWLSLCAFLATTSTTLKLLDWVFKPNAYIAEVQL